MLRMRKGSRGFTLVELMVVMAIMAVLAGIVMPAVSGTREVSEDAQVRNDAGIVAQAIQDYFADQGGAAVLTPSTTTILGTATAQQKNGLWPEDFLTAVYGTASTGNDAEFPAAGAAAAGDVTAIYVTSSVSGVGGALTLANAFTALDQSALVTGGYLPKEPLSFNATVTVGTKAYSAYLWLLQKTTVKAGTGETVASRAVAVFKLAKVDVGADTFHTLTYEQIY